MPIRPIRPHKGESPSTYFVQDRKNEKECARLKIQDHMITMGMGGVLSEQADPTAFYHVLDVGCGTGGWVIDAAQTYPEMSLVGIDISQHMIKYAFTQAEAHQVHDRVKFHVMDVLLPLDFPAASFDLTNLRFGISFVRTWDWSRMLGEMLRVTRPGGVVRVTEANIIHQTNSSALIQLCEMLQCAFFRAGNLFAQEATGLASELTQLFSQRGCQQVQTRGCALEYRRGTPEGDAFCEAVKLLFLTSHPFIQKWGCLAKNYDAIYRQVLEQMGQPDFFAILNLLTVWGSKP
jgi:ubiquinone/menaquinone biosynthesis C-methylase UbiE